MKFNVITTWNNIVVGVTEVPDPFINTTLKFKLWDRIKFVVFGGVYGVHLRPQCEEDKRAMIAFCKDTPNETQI